MTLVPAHPRTTTLVEQFEFGLDAPICLTWELTYACNLQCVHCLSSSGQRDPRELTTAEDVPITLTPLAWFLWPGGSPAPLKCCRSLAGRGFLPEQSHRGCDPPRAAGPGRAAVRAPRSRTRPGGARRAGRSTPRRRPDRRAGR